MKKKFLGRVLTMLLVASMVFTLLPAPAIAAGNWWWNTEEYTEEAVPTATTDANYHYNIFFLDCGRKYYSVESIKKLIDNASAARFNYIQLAVGNDGLRFLLNDMSLTVGTTTYTDKQVRDAIQAGNLAYNKAVSDPYTLKDGQYRYEYPYSSNVNELTQSEMNTIIAYAKSKGMGVIPCVNTPGHMDAILSAANALTGTNCSYNGSVRTIDVTNETAVAFTKALLQKYITYFRSQGCQLFNMGADEYANDKYTSGGMGFGQLISSNRYKAYGDYINAVAGMIKNAGMTPMAFNDGIYFWDNESCGEIDRDILICYWSCGWGSVYSGYCPMSASNLAGKGFKMVNTNGDYYYVLGKDDKYSYLSNDNKIPFKSDAETLAQGFETTKFMGSDIANPVGSMLCVWSDFPGAETEDTVVSQSAAVIRGFGSKLPELTSPTPTPPDGGTTPPETITEPVNGTKEITVDGYNYENNVDRSELDTNVATVTVKGQDGEPESATYTKTQVAISAIAVSGDWEKSPNNYYKDGENYYPIYCMRETEYLYGFTRSTYYYGYSKTDSSSDVEKLGQTSYGYTPVTVYVKGDTVPGIPASTTVTFYGLAKGMTYVTIGNVKYTINVVPEDVNNVTPLSIEYWITNGEVQRSESDTTKSLTVSAKMDGIAAPEGVEVTAATMIPQNGYRDGRTVDYWQCRLLDTSISNTYGDNTQKQTIKDGDDETASGVAFTKVRYYGGSWAVYTEKNEWVNVESKHQLVAYYMEHIQVTDEVDSHAADWGNIGDGRTGGWIDYPYCTLSVQVVYEDGTKNPVNEAAENLKAKSIVYGYWGDGRGIGTVLLSGNRDFEIVKVTAKKGTVNATISNKNSANITKFEWNKDETAVTVWEDEKGSMEASVHAPAKAFNEADKNNNLVWTSESQAILLRVYVRAKVTEDSLTVNYYDESNLAKPFYNYNIAVAKETYFDNDIALNNPWKGNLKNGTVRNIKGVDQTVSADLYTMPAIGANYRYMEYTCTHVDKIEDEAGHVKTVNLYYTFTNKVTFVADFGLPIRIPLTEINDTLKNATINEVTVRGAEYGTVSADTSGITYTPTKVFGADAEALQVSVKGQITVQGESGSTEQKSEVAYQVYILPASNVLYEENFLTEAPASSGLGWTKVTSNKLGSQETQKVNGTGSYNVFGRDAAYDAVTGELGVWKLGSEQNPLQDNTFYASCLTTEFYGNGFDLIGNCGPTTGRVSVLIAGKNGGYIYDVDTRYNDGKNTTLYQVPLMHIDLHDEGIYTVKVYGSGLAKTTVFPASYSLSGAATYASNYAVGGYDTVLSDILAENGLTMADVEYVKVESAPAVTTRGAASFYALDTADVGGTVTHEAGTHVEIDGFRVYRSTNNANYPTSEQNVKYVNVLGAVTFEKDKVAYTELNGAHELVSREDYESNGGPQNEIYLMNGQSVVFNLGRDMTGKTVQITARAVTDKAAMLNKTSISSNTEMYYEVTVGEGGTLAIQNDGEGMLAIANLKVPNTVTFNTVTAETLAIAERMLLAYAGASGEGDAFAPAISAKVTTTRFIRSKVVTLTVSASSDVAVLKVNGVELRPTNSWLVKMGWSDTYTYILTEKVQKNEIKTYEIVGYRADGAASAPIVAESK